MPHAPLLIPHFFALNLPQTIEFYTTKLGFTHLPETNPDYADSHAILFLGPSLKEARAFVMFYAFPCKHLPDAKFSTAEWTLKLDEGKGKNIVDEWYEKWVAKGVEAVRPPEDKPWGIRSAKLKDCNGHIIMPYYWLVD